MVKNELVQLSFIDDDGKQKDGVFEKIEETLNFIKIKTKKNIITIPFHRIIKIKEKLK